MAPPGHATYVYCLVRAPERPDLSTAPPGLVGLSAPRLLDAGGCLWLVAADAPLALYGSGAIGEVLDDLDRVAACAVAHEEVVESFLRAGTVVPLRMFTLFSDDERALAHILEDRPGIDRMLERVAGRREWGVRVHFERETVARGASEGAAKADPSSPGRAFLERKKEARSLSRSLLERAHRRVESIYGELALEAVESVRRPAAQGPDGDAVLHAAFLVEEPRAAGFRRAVERAASEAAEDGCRVVLTGPWPAYHFVGEAT